MDTELQAKLKHFMHYNPETGIFTRLVNSTSTKKGSVAGYMSTNGYVNIGFNNRAWRAHRLAFLYMTGEIPEFVDHIDRNRSNNKWVNLRPATRLQNNTNRPLQKNNRLGLKGVRKHRNKFHASLYINDKYHWIGSFDDPNEAHEAYKAYAKQHHGEFYAEN
jgi:hypothetical protein